MHQIRNLRKIRAFVSNATLSDHRQNEIRTRCLQYWEVSHLLYEIVKRIDLDFQVPDEPRQKPRRLICNDVQNDLFYQVKNFHSLSILF